MATTLLPVDPAASPQRATRLLTISANLLPEEVVRARQIGRIRIWVIVFVLLVAAACGGWVAYANNRKQQADRELTEATTQVLALQRDQRKYADVVKVRSDTELLRKQLKSVMAKDLDWGTLLTLLRTTGEPEKITVTGVNGKLTTASDAAEATGALPSTSKSGSIGQIVVTGTGPDKKAVAAYVDLLAQKPTLANPYVTNVAATEEGNVTFSLTVDITQKALCGRFGEPCKPSGGK
ncbi:PilN domain-containing protein [Nucisporomicrobium flavum]|uniref:PilN domain-containing protein n=1 Tax=Nucisporomicrobium flavum TaxID=2785915 RepID=UPI0018F33F87|nr:hypothetical protein [Nucisporomicrobium flavum]